MTVLLTHRQPKGMSDMAKIIANRHTLKRYVLT